MIIEDLFNIGKCPVCNCGLSFSEDMARDQVYWCRSYANEENSHYSYYLDYGEVIIKDNNIKIIIDDIDEFWAKDLASNERKDLPCSIIHNSNNINDLLNKVFKIFKFKAFQ